MGNLGLGLQLMLVGMVTVFLILFIVIYGSRLLISIINRIAPEAAQKPKSQDASSDIPMDILKAAVDQITGGKGTIINVTRK